MKLFRILGRNIRDSFKSVFRNFALSLASITSITITLIVVAISMLLSYNVNNVASEIEKSITIVTFLKADVTDSRISEIEEEINKLNNVESYIFKSKMDIIEQYKEETEIFKAIMENWDEDENPLLHSFLVKVIDINQISDTAQKIESLEGVSLVNYGKNKVEQLTSVLDIIRKISIVTVVALILVTAFLISNTIKITIHSRKREIDIMRLVGASNINIKIPFILEGLFLGIIGSIIPIIVVTYGYTSFHEHFRFDEIIKFVKLIEPTPFIYVTSGLLLCIGMVVGMFGSWRAVRKHLKI